MTNALIFPWATSIGLYSALIIGIIIAVFVDLWMLKRHKAIVSYKASLIETLTYMSLSLLFAVFIYYYVQISLGQTAVIAKTVTLEFLAGYAVEQILSIDNIFVFCMIFSIFKIPVAYQKRVLLIGILSAVILRIMFIALGSALMQYQFVSIVLGIVLILTGLKILKHVNHNEALKKNTLVEWLLKKLPLTAELEGEKFFVKRNKKLYATPLLASLLFIECSDIVFAIDSVPAVFAVTKEPFIVFSSNIFAILGLRSLYSLVAKLTEQFYYIRYGIASILVFVGIKLVFHEKMQALVSPMSSLIIILVLFLFSMLISLWLPAPKNNKS